MKGRRPTQRYFRVRNFEAFQHYKDRSPPWIKLYADVLGDYEMSCLQDASKLHLVFIWVLASRTNNRLPYDAEWIGQRIQATDKVDLDALQALGFIEVEQVASGALADCKQSACLETETETETEEEESSYELSCSSTQAPSERKRDLKPTEQFERWWTAYPRKQAKRDAARAWTKARLDGRADQLVVDVARRVAECARWRDPKFIPLPATYLNGERWNDEITPVTTDPRARDGPLNGHANPEFNPITGAPMHGKPLGHITRSALAAFAAADAIDAQRAADADARGGNRHDPVAEPETGLLATGRRDGDGDGGDG